MKILQINIDRGGEAHDLMLRTARVEKIDVCLIGEPHRRKSEEWYGHENAKILVVNNQLFVRNKGTGSGHTWFDIDNIRLVSCYISPNSGLEDLMEILESISNTLRSREEREVVIGGDINAKSWGWGSAIQDRRGYLVTEWIESENLIIHNNGNKPTFKRGNQGTFIDVTLSTEGIASKIRHWKVRDDIETLSYHQYIDFEITNSHRTENAEKSEGWKINTINIELLRSKLTERRAENETQLTELIVEACDVAMKRKGGEKKKEVYWWNEEINTKRKESIRQRRLYTRLRRRHASEDICELKYIEYMKVKREFKEEIRKSKTKCWKDLCQKLQEDIWGEAYRIVTKKIRCKPPEIPVDIRETQINKLFPDYQLFTWEEREIPEEEIPPITMEELVKASQNLAPNKAPGPDFIPPKIIKEAVMMIPETFRSIFNTLIKKGTFPKIWKEARVVLLEKPVKNRGDPPSFRPICLINSIGKLFEGIINERLRQEIEEKHLLNDQQYGFRKGRSTIHAIRKITETVKKELEKRGDCRNRKICLLVTLDVKNAFNTANWRKIIKAMEDKNISRYLISIIQSYLHERMITKEAFPKQMSAGVPQGSKVGPTLWNIMYDSVLNLDLPEEVRLVGYADDLAVLVLARTERELEVKANITLDEISRWMTRNELTLAPEKSEAMIISGRKTYKPIKIQLGGLEIMQKDKLKYLGVILDKKLSFQPHIDHVTAKAEKTVTALSRLVPNLGGPGENKRRMLQNAADSVLLYAAPVWAECLKVKKNSSKLLKTQRKFCLRVSCSYRTVSTEAAAVIARAIPIDLLLEERSRTYGKSKEEIDREREYTIEKWQERWSRSEKGKWTRELIKDIKPWIERKHGEVDYFLTQGLSGHGSFQKYVHKIGKSPTSACLYCEEDDTPEHTLFLCTKWALLREQTKYLVGEELRKDNIINIMLQNENNWNSVGNMIREIMKKKEEYERHLRAQNPNQTSAP